MLHKFVALPPETYIIYTHYIKCIDNLSSQRQTAALESLFHPSAFQSFLGTNAHFYLWAAGHNWFTQQAVWSPSKHALGDQEPHCDHDIIPNHKNIWYIYVFVALMWSHGSVNEDTAIWAFYWLLELHINSWTPISHSMYISWSS